MWTDTPLSRHLGLKAPIIQGPFGGGLSSAALAATVSNAGGLGSFGAHHLEPEAILETARAVRHLTEQPFALNLWVPPADPDQPEAFERGLALLAPYYRELGLTPPQPPADDYWPRFEDQAEALIEARPAVFSFVYGVPPKSILDRCRDKDIMSLGTATTVAEARALETAGVDMIVATGFEAGGHRVSFLDNAEASLTGSLALLPQVADAVSVPVIAAGGIADGRGVAAALILGAQGVQVGTAFLVCAESSASATHRRMLFSDRAANTGLTRAFSGRLARGIRNRLMTEMEGADGLPGYPLQTWLTKPLKDEAARRDDPELMALWAGQAAPLLRHHRADALFDGLVAQTHAILGGRL